MNVRNLLFRIHAGRHLPETRAVRGLLVLLLFCAGRGIRAQVTVPETAPATYAGFDGRNVADVNISAGPSVNSEALQPLIRQKAGTPFSASAIRESVTALEKTKQFSSIQVRIDFASSGLDVLFVLQPTSYIGLISFPGADHVISYPRLLQAVNISDQTPYFKALLARGQSALLAYLREDGYFAATVQPTIERDDTHRVVNLIFRTDLGERAKIGKIVIKGVSQQTESQILQGLGSLWSKLKGRSLTPGQTYDPDRIRKASSYVVDQFRKDDHLTATLRQLPPEYNAENNRTNITFQANLGPVVTIRVAGTHVSNSTILQEVPIEQEGVVNQDVVDRGGGNLLNYFQSKGHSQARVNSRMSRQGNHVSILYTVDLGARYRLKEVFFRGNHYFGEDQLESIVSVQERRAILWFPINRGKFSQDLLNQSVDSIKTLYNNAGFANAAIHPKVTTAGNQVNVEFDISEGTQDRVETLRVEGNRNEPRSALAGGKPLNLQPGKPYSRHRLDLDRNQILAAYFNSGYPDARFNAKVTPSGKDPHLMDVVYTITEGPQGHISAVVPLGQKVTRPSLIRNVVRPNVSPGMPLSAGKFLAAESDLYNLNIFDWADVTPLWPTSYQTQDALLVKVHETRRYTMDIGGGIEVIPRSGNVPVGTVALPGVPAIGIGSKFTVSQKSFFGPRFSFSLSRNNMLGRAETATISTVVSRLDQSGLFTYADPRLWGVNWSSLFSLSAERTTTNPVFTAVIGQASFQVQRPLDPARTKNLIFRYSYNRTDLSNILIPDLVLPQDRRVRLSTFFGEYTRDTRDNVLDAHHGMFQTFDFGITPTALGSSANFIRLLGQNAVYVPVQPWLTWATNIRLGFTIPFAGSVVPLSERFFSGGPDSLRGFPINGAGPQRPVQVCSDPSNPSTCSLISVPVGGNMLFILNTEARFPIGLLKNLEGAVFYDGGNVYKNINFRQWVNDYTNTVGGGLRYRTPVGPIRFDVGYRLTPIPGVKALQYFVTVGQSF